MTAHVAAPPVATPVPGIEDAPPPPDDALPGTDEAQPPDKRRRRKVALLLLLMGLLAGLLFLAIWYFWFRQPIPIPVIPPPALPSYSTSIYGATSPVGIAVTPDGERIYVTEAGGDRVVRIFDGGGRQVGVARPPVETGNDHVPVYVAIDPLTSEVYVSDRPTGSIYVYDREGTYLREYEPADPIVGWQPLGLAFDAAGSLYVTELRGPGQRVLVFDREGELARTIGTDLNLNFPNGVAVDGAGNAWITDSNNGRLIVVGAEGQVVGRIGRGAAKGNLGLPRGVATDGQGRVFVVDSTGQGVQVYKLPAEGQPQPDYLGFFGGQGVNDAQFGFPMGVATDDRGRVYVADTSNNRIQVWSY